MAARPKPSLGNLTSPKNAEICYNSAPYNMTTLRKHFHTDLDVLMSQEEGKYYAHCLPFDLLAEGETEEEAMKRLAEMVFSHIKFFMENNMEPFIFRPAPMKYWEVLRMVKKQPQHFLPRIPEGLLKATSPNRIASYLNPVNAPACS